MITTARDFTLAGYVDFSLSHFLVLYPKDLIIM